MQGTAVISSRCPAPPLALFARRDSAKSVPRLCIPRGHRSLIPFHGPLNANKVQVFQKQVRVLNEWWFRVEKSKKRSCSSGPCHRRPRRVAWDVNHVCSAIPQNSVVKTLQGVFHPRIVYPAAPVPSEIREAVQATAPSAPVPAAVAHEVRS